MKTAKKVLGTIQYNAPVVLTFTFLSAIVVLLQSIFGARITAALFSVYPTSFTDPLMYLRLFLHVLGHSGWNHFFNNFLIILLIGPMLEEKYGSKNMIYMIAFCALFTGLIHIIFYDVGLYGASGVVFMMILLGSYANYQEGKIPLTLILVVIAFIGREVMAGVINQGMDNVAHFTHIIGGACGGVFGYRLNRGKNPISLNDNDTATMDTGTTPAPDETVK